MKSAAGRNLGTNLLWVVTEPVEARAPILVETPRGAAAGRQRDGCIKVEFTVSLA
jgi:hypothetical protein